MFKKEVYRRNYKEYRNLSLKEYVNLKNVPLEKRINDGSLKNHIKHIKKFFVFCSQNRLIKYNPTENLNIKVNLDKKDSFTQEEINQLIKIVNEYENDLKHLYLMIIYTGMRRSEVYNCTIKEENGIKYFDITDSKTINGRRKIPIHSKIYYLTNDILNNAKNITNPINFGAIFNNKIKVRVTKSNKKTLHSIRHYVATKLKRNVINDSIIKSILGHSNTDTLNRVYAREGYSVKQLKEFIEYL
jgi:integrase